MDSSSIASAAFWQVDMGSAETKQDSVDQRSRCLLRCCNAEALRHRARFLLDDCKRFVIGNEFRHDQFSAMGEKMSTSAAVDVQGRGYAREVGGNDLASC